MPEPMDQLKPNLRKIYIGNLPPEYSESHLRAQFSKFGTITTIDCKPKFAFVEYQDESSAEEAMRRMHGSYFGSDTRISVQPHKPGLGTQRVLSRATSYHVAAPTQDGGDRRIPLAPAGGGGGGGGGRDSRRTEFRVVLFNLDDRVSWQDLKDFGRNAGEVNFANVFMRNGRKIGIVEYFTEEAMRRAVEELDGRKLYDSRLHIERDRGQLEPTEPQGFRLLNQPSSAEDGRNTQNYYRGATASQRSPYPSSGGPVFLPPPGAKQQPRSGRSRSPLGPTNRYYPADARRSSRRRSVDREGLSGRGSSRDYSPHANSTRVSSLRNNNCSPTSDRRGGGIYPSSSSAASATSRYPSYNYRARPNESRTGEYYGKGGKPASDCYYYYESRPSTGEYYNSAEARSNEYAGGESLAASAAEKQRQRHGSREDFRGAPERSSRSYGYYNGHSSGSSSSSGYWSGGGGGGDHRAAADHFSHAGLEPSSFSYRASGGLSGTRQPGLSGGASSSRSDGENGAPTTTATALPTSGAYNNSDRYYYNSYKRESEAGGRAEDGRASSAYYYDERRKYQQTDESQQKLLYTGGYSSPRHTNSSSFPHQQPYTGGVGGGSASLRGETDSYFYGRDDGRAATRRDRRGEAASAVDGPQSSETRRRRRSLSPPHNRGDYSATGTGVRMPGITGGPRVEGRGREEDKRLHLTGAARQRTSDNYDSVAAGVGYYRGGADPNGSAAVLSTFHENSKTFQRLQDTSGANTASSIGRQATGRHPNNSNNMQVRQMARKQALE